MSYTTPWVWSLDNKAATSRSDFFVRLTSAGFAFQTQEQTSKFLDAISNFPGTAEFDKELKATFGRSRKEVQRFYQVAGGTLLKYAVTADDPSGAMELLKRGCNGVLDIQHRRETTTFAEAHGIINDPWRDRPEVRLPIAQAAADGFTDLVRELVHRFGEWQLHVPFKGITPIQTAFKYGEGATAMAIFELDETTADDAMGVDLPEVADRLITLRSGREARKILSELGMDLGTPQP